MWIKYYTKFYIQTLDQTKLNWVCRCIPESAVLTVKYEGGSSVLYKRTRKSCNAPRDIREEFNFKMIRHSEGGDWCLNKLTAPNTQPASVRTVPDQAAGWAQPSSWSEFPGKCMEATSNDFLLKSSHSCNRQQQHCDEVLMLLWNKFQVNSRTETPREALMKTRRN